MATEATAKPKKSKKGKLIGRRMRIRIEGPKANGRPVFEPTDEQRTLIQRLRLANGATEEQIAEIVGVGLSTLRKYFHRELNLSTLELMANVGATLYQQALAGNTQAAMFLMRTRGGWTERKELTGADGKPLVPDAAPPVLLVDFSGVLDDEPDEPSNG